MNVYRTEISKLLIPALFASVLGGTAMLAYGAAEYGTATEAKAMLDRAVTAVKANKSEALAAFTRGQEGFKDRDLYVFCGGPDGMFTAHPTLMGKSMKDIKDKAGKALGAEIYGLAKKDEFATVSYLWPRPGTTEPTRKTTYVTKIDDQVCGVGYYN